MGQLLARSTQGARQSLCKWCLQGIKHAINRSGLSKSTFEEDGDLSAATLSSHPDSATEMAARASVDNPKSVKQTMHCSAMAEEHKTPGTPLGNTDAG